MRKIFAATVAGLGFASTALAGNVLIANPGPDNNGGSPGWGVFFDLSAGADPLSVTGLTTASTAVAGGSFSFEVFTRSGTALGGPVGSGPGSSLAGWTSLGVANATQGATSGGISNFVNIPDIFIGAGNTVGVALVFADAGPRYFGQGTPALGNYSDGNLTLVTGDARSAPFTTGGSFFSSREFVGSFTYTIIPTPGAAALLGMAGLVGARRRR